MIEIFLTSDGPQLIDNDNRVKVVRSILSGNVYLHDIVHDTGMSKSTVYSSLKVLMGMGIVTSEGEGNSRSYHVSATSLLYSCERDNSVDERRIVDLVKKNDDLNVPDLMIVLSILYSLHRYGISIETITSNTGRRLAQISMERDDMRTLDDAIRFLEDTKFVKIRTVSADPYVFEIELCFDIQGDSFRTFMMLFARYLERYISDRNGHEYHISSYDRINDRIASITFGTEEIDGRALSRLSSDIDLKNFKGTNFSLYNGVDGIVAVSGNMKSVADVLEKKEASSIELSDELGMPQTTVIGYLNQLDSAGLLSSRRVGNRNVYISKAQHILECLSPRDNDDDPFDLLREVYNDPRYLLKYALIYAGLISYKFGFRLSSLLSSLGRCVAWTSINATESRNIDDLFKFMCRTQFIPSVECTILSYSPMTTVIRFNYKLNDSVVEMMKVLINAYMSGLMEYTTNNPYKVTVTNFSGEEYVSFKSVLEPDHRGMTNSLKPFRSI